MTGTSESVPESGLCQQGSLEKVEDSSASLVIGIVFIGGRSKLS